MKTVDDVTKDFLKSILVAISKNSSKSYGIFILKNLKKRLIKDYPLFKLIKFNNSNIEIDAKILTANTNDISKLLNKIINMLGPDILKLFIKDHLDNYDIKYLNSIGVRF